MVRVVSRLFLIGCAIIATTIAAAQSDLTATVNDTNIELGKYITLKLSAPASMPPLNEINLSRLTTSFHIDTRNDVVNESGTQTWKLRLYPYNKGKPLIPTLELNKLKTESIQITVTDAIDRKSYLPLTIQYSVSTTSPWVREQVLMIYTLTSTQKQYDLQLTDSKHPAASIYTLGTEEIRNEDTEYNLAAARQKSEGKPIFQYKTGYAIFNLKPGTQQLNLPPLILKRDGTTTHHFYPPPLKLTVKALPLYLPATVPVGTLALKTGKTYQFRLTDRLTSTTVSLKGKQVLPSTLPDLAHQLNSTDSIQTYPETHNEQQIKYSSGINTIIDYSVPLKPVAQGVHSLDPIRVLNFDPETGTLQATQYRLPRLLSLNIWLAVFLTLLVTMVSFFVLVKLYHYISFQFRRYRYYKLALQQLYDSKNPQSIRKALILISQAEGRSENLSPQAWLEHFTTTPIKTKLIEPLNQLFYRRYTEEDTSDLIQNLTASIKSRHLLILNKFP